MAKYFETSDFACRCGCGKNNTKSLLIQMWDEVREICGFPIKLNRGCSCEKHNKKVGGKDTSSHITGKAGDVKAVASRKRLKIIEAMLKVGFNRIGVGKTFIHGDIDKSKPQKVMWVY